MTIRHVARRLLAGLATLVLAAGCAGSTSPTIEPGRDASDRHADASTDGRHSHGHQ
jgi:hypothetical protein